MAFLRQLNPSSANGVPIIPDSHGKAVEVRSFSWFRRLIGIISGTYSSIFVAAPLLVDWHLWDDRRHGRLAARPRPARPAHGDLTRGIRPAKGRGAVARGILTP